MKHLHKTFIGSALTLALAGCNDFLDLSSYDEVSSGTAFGGMCVRAMWAVIAASLPGALSICNTTYPIFSGNFSG